MIPRYQTRAVEATRLTVDLLVLTRPIAALCSGVQVQVLVGGHLTARATGVDELVLLRAGSAIAFVVPRLDSADHHQDGRTSIVE